VSELNVGRPWFERINVRALGVSVGVGVDVGVVGVGVAIAFANFFKASSGSVRNVIVPDGGSFIGLLVGASILDSTGTKLPITC
jgi:hypothetical protein